MRPLTNPDRPRPVAVRPTRWREVIDRLPGLSLVGALAAVAIALGKIGWFESTGISALTLAIVLGMFVGNTLYPRIAPLGASGVTFSKQTLLRLGIILYGLRLTFQDIATVGILGVTIDSLVLSSTFICLGGWAHGFSGSIARPRCSSAPAVRSAALRRSWPPNRSCAAAPSRSPWRCRPWWCSARWRSFCIRRSLFGQPIPLAGDVALRLRHLCRLHDS